MRNSCICGHEIEPKVFLARKTPLMAADFFCLKMGHLSLLNHSSFWSINFNPDYVKQGFLFHVIIFSKYVFLNANSVTKLWRGPMIVGSFISIYRKCFDPSVPFKRLKTSNVTKFVDFWCVWQEDAPKWYLQRIYDCSFGIQETIWSQL